MSSRPSTAALPRVPSRSASRAVQRRRRRRGRERRAAPASPRGRGRRARSRRSRRRPVRRGRWRRAGHARVRCRRRGACWTSGSGRRRRSCAPNFATSSSERCTQCAHQTSSASQPTLVEVLDRRAAVELAAVLLFLHGLREVRVQPQPEPARQLCRLGHQLARDRERRARRDGDLAPVRRPRGRLRLQSSARTSSRVSDDRVGRKPPLRLAEVHRAA